MTKAAAKITAGQVNGVGGRDPRLLAEVEVFPIHTGLNPQFADTSGGVVPIDSAAVGAKLTSGIGLSSSLDAGLKERP